MTSTIMYRLTIIAFVAAVSANVYIESPCPETKPVDNFNLQMFGQGTWYEVARYNNTAERKGNCGYVEYKLENNVIKMKNAHIENHKLAYIEGTGKLADDAGNTGKLIYSLPYGPSGSETKNTLNILDIDYNNYAIGYHCQYDEEKKTRQDFAWIFSRTKKLEGSAKIAVDNFIKDCKILDGSKLVWPGFSEEACKIEA